MSICPSVRPSVRPSVTEFTRKRLDGLRSNLVYGHFRSMAWTSSKMGQIGRRVRGVVCGRWVPRKFSKSGYFMGMSCPSVCLSVCRPQNFTFYFFMKIILGGVPASSDRPFVGWGSRAPQKLTFYFFMKIILGGVPASSDRPLVGWGSRAPQKLTFYFFMK